jgi:hydrogen peroxide-dependent heme synthase
MFSMAPSKPTMPPVPLTLEGSYVLHQMLRVRWREWKALPASERAIVVAEAADVVGKVENPGPVQSAVFSLLGHKGDLMVVHFRESLDALNRIELALVQLRLWDFLELSTSYLSVVELGLYESTVKTYQVLLDRNIEPHSPEWDRELAGVVERQTQAMHARLFPEIPNARYICFYPMDRKRGETKNFYKLPIGERQRQMHDHGLVGRRYAGAVKQIITGSIGFDDWEWGVDLFADDPLVFKKLIYEMRFDEVSAEYALFGSFYVGLRCPASALGLLLSGDGPKRPS